MDAAKACSLGTMSHSLYDVGGVSGEYVISCSRKHSIIDVQLCRSHVRPLQFTFALQYCLNRHLVIHLFAVPLGD